MRHLIGVLYLLTALVGFYWSVYLSMTGLYGVPFSRWYVVILIGSLVLLAGALFWWTSKSEWTRWMPIIGSALLASYFVPAIIEVLRDGGFAQPMKLLVRVGVVVLVVASLLVAVGNKLQTGRN